MRQYEPTELFKGTAWYYARYRRPYPHQLIRFLIRAARLTTSSRVLDLGSGPGNLSIPLSRYVRQVVAVDPDSDMLAEGRRLARDKEATNVQWQLGSSYDLSKLDVGRVDAATIGQAFHWMDREQTLRDLDHIVNPEGSVAVVGGPKRTGREPPWASVIEQAVGKWLGEERRAGSTIYQHPTERFEDTLRQSTFSSVTIRRFRWRVDSGIDEVIGLLFSTSYSSPALLGEMKEGFERELRSELARIQPGGRFAETVQAEVFIARRPQSATLIE